MNKTKQNLLKALLNSIGQNKVCDSLADINKAFNILLKAQKQEIKEDLIKELYYCIGNDENWKRVKTYLEDKL